MHLQQVDETRNLPSPFPNIAETATLRCNMMSMKEQEARIRQAVIQSGLLWKQARPVSN